MAFSSSRLSPNFQLIINIASEFGNIQEAHKERPAYTSCRRQAPNLQYSHCGTSILAILRQQIQGSRGSDARWTRLLDPTVNVLFALSATLGEGVGPVCLINLSDICTSYLFGKHAYQLKWYLPESVSCFQYASLLINMTLWAIHCNASISQAAKDARANQDALIDIFERIEMFFRHLENYSDVPPTLEMIDIVVRIMVEVLSVLGSL